MSLADNLRRSPEWLPHSLDVAGDRVLFLRLGEGEYRAASFLDGRIVTPASTGQWIEMARVIEAAAGLPDTWRGIFHIGHVGSTLISRLLGEVPGLFALREPAAMRTLADSDPDAAESWWDRAAWSARVAALDALWSRAWRQGEVALVKVTSVASVFAAARAAIAPCLFVTARAETYLATILAQEGNRAEAVALAPARLRRLNRRIGGPVFRLAAMGEGERVAMAWACEMATLDEAANERVAWVDFDGFLAAPAEGLAAAAAHLGAGLGAGEAERLVEGPLMRAYAKGPEHAYSAGLRAEVLAVARREHGREIATGLRWLEGAGARYPAVARVLGRLGG